MPCFCGHRVDRTQTSVQCEKCRQIYHLNCVVGSLPADLNLINSADNIYVCGVCAPDQQNESMISPNSSLQQQVTQVQMPNPLSANDCVVELKTFNSNLLSALSVLHGDNECLRQKIDSLQAEVRDLHCKLTENNSILSRLLTQVEKQCSANNYNTPTSLGASGPVNGAATAADGLYNQIASDSAVHSAANSSIATAAITSTATGSVDGATKVAERPYNQADTASNAQPPTITLQIDAAATATTSSSTPIPDAAASQLISPSSVTNENSPEVVGNPNGWKIVQNKRSNRRKNKNKIQNDIEFASNDANAVAGISNMPINSNNAVMENDNIRAIQGNSRLLAQPLVVGSGINSDISAVSKREWLHLSPFSASVTSQKLKAHISRHTGINENAIVCIPLVKNGVDPISLRFVNFKLGVDPIWLPKLLVPELWPTNIAVRPFNFRSKNGEGQLIVEGNQLGPMEQ